MQCAYCLSIPFCVLIVFSAFDFNGHVVYSYTHEAIKRGVCLLLCALFAYSRKSSNNSIKNRRLIAIKREQNKQLKRLVTFKERERI